MLPVVATYLAKKATAAPAKTGDSAALKNNVIAGILLLGAGTGVVLGIRHLVKKARQTSESKDILKEGDPAQIASMLKMAFDNDTWLGMGTDEDMVYKAFEMMPTRAFYQKVIDSYSYLNYGNLSLDLQNELDSSEIAKVQQILNSKPAR